jgi:hypothetical protein
MRFSKRRALFISIASAVGVYGFYINQQYQMMWAMIASTALFFCIWLDKVIRDINAISEAKQEQAEGVETSQMPTMTSKGSRRLFVPEPLND